MGSSYTPPVVAPVSFIGTTLPQVTFGYDGTHASTMSVASGGKSTLDNVNGEDWTISGGGNAFVRFAFGGITVIGSGTAVIAISGGAFAAGTPRYIGSDGVSGLGCPATNQISLVANGSDALIASTTLVTIKSGIALKIGNAAVTGLIAGALAALTNASVTIQDANGTVYRVPVIV